MKQLFNGDDLELKFSGSFDLVFADMKEALLAIIGKAYGAKALGYTLYDGNTSPLNGVIERETFALYYDDIFKTFPYAGTFESYIFILKKIFGEEAEISFTKLAPAALQIDITSDRNTFFKWIESVVSKSAITDESGNAVYFRRALGMTDYYKVRSILNIFKHPGVYLEFNIILKEPNNE